MGLASVSLAHHSVLEGLNAAAVPKNKTSTVRLLCPFSNTVHRRTFSRGPLRRPLKDGSEQLGSWKSELRRRDLSVCCCSTEDVVMHMGQRVRELAPLMFFTVTKSVDWLIQPFKQGPLKELLSSTAVDLAMAAGGLIISIFVTGAWKSLPWLRNLAKEVEEEKAPFVVPVDYYSRKPEEDLLLAMLEGDPRDIMLLTGPPSSGKTALIARVLQRREERKETPREELKESSMIRSVAGSGIYVNMRFGDFLGSNQMGCELSGQFRKYIESLSGIADAEVRRVLGKEDQVRIGVQILKALRLTKKKPPDEVTRWIDSLEKSQVGCEGIETAVKKIEQILRRLRPGLGEGSKSRRNDNRRLNELEAAVEERLLPPVIVIDAAEELMRWSDPASLNILLRFFVGISSERRQSHVVLVSSDPKMQSWLEERVGAHLSNVQVLRDLLKYDASRFFEAAAAVRLGGRAADVTGDVTFEDDVWPIIGGRIALMQRVLERGVASGSLRTALHAERAVSENRLSRALGGLSQSDKAALQEAQNGNGNSNLEPLVKAGIMHRYPWSELGNLGQDRTDSIGSGLEFVFPADSALFNEVAKWTNVVKSQADDKKSGEPSASLAGESSSSKNGRDQTHKKSFYEV